MDLSNSEVVNGLNPDDLYITKNRMQEDVFKSKTFDAGIDTKDDLQKSKTFEESKSAQHNKFMAAYDSYNQAYKEASESKWKYRSKDSKKMSAVKDSIKALNTFFNEREVPKDRAGLDADIKELKGLYEAIRNQCNTYLKSHRHTITETGIARKNMVKKQLAMAEIEIRRLDESAEDIYKLAEGKEERPIWINILADIRVVKLDLKKDDPNVKIEKTGAATSEVLKVTVKKNEKSRTGYIKKWENMVPTDVKMKEDFFDNELIDKKDRKILGAIVNNILRPIDGMVSTLDGRTSVYEEMTKYLKANRGFKAIDQQEGGMMRLYKAFKKSVEDNGYMKKFEILAEKLGFKGFDSMAQHIIKTCEYMDAENKLSLNHSIAQLDAKIEWGSNISKRNVATTRMAKLLGLGHAIAKSEKVSYKDEKGKDQLGIIMESAGDLCLHDVDKAENEMSRQVLLDLNSIQLFDVICGQIDRHKGNLIVDTEKYEKDGKTNYKIKGIKGIDNDMSFGNIKYDMVKKVGRNRMIRFEDKGGLCHMKKLDKKLVDSLMAMTDEMVEYAMADLLSKDEMAALIDRIHGVKNAIKKTLADKSGKNLLIDRDNISDSDAKAMRRQLSSKVDWKIRNIKIE